MFLDSAAHKNHRTILRQFFEAKDFGPEFTPELREAEDRMRAELTAQ